MAEGQNFHLVSCIPPSDVRQWGPLVKEYLEGVVRCSAGRWDADLVLERCQQKKAQLWVFSQLEHHSEPVLVGAIVTEICVYPKAKSLQVWIGGGDLELMIDHLPWFERFAKIEGAATLEIHGPPDLRKRLVREGFHLLYVANVKEL